MIRTRNQLINNKQAKIQERIHWLLKIKLVKQFKTKKGKQVKSEYQCLVQSQIKTNSKFLSQSWIHQVPDHKPKSTKLSD